MSDQTSKNEIFRLLELNHLDSESSSSSSDHEIHQIYQLSSEPSRASSNSSSGPDVGMACKDSCCRNKTINVLSKHEELILNLIDQINDPIIKAQRLSEFHKALVKEPSKLELRIQEPKVDLKKIYNRFTKSKKEVTINDLQKEIKETKSKVKSLEQEVTILRVDHNFLDQRLKHLENTSHQVNEEGTSFQNPSDEEVDKTVNPTTDMVQEESSEKFLETINRINFQKWHSKVRIVISRNFEFEVIALIDSGVDLNCIQEGIIPSKYFKKTRERLTSTSGGKMQIEFKIPNAHVCQDNTCFKTTFVLVKNVTDRVILGNPFMCLLYPFITDSEGITTHPFGHPVKFKFLRSPEPREISNLQNVSVSKTLNPLTAKIHKKCNQAQNLDSFVSTAYYPVVEFPDPNQSRNSPQHIQHTNIFSLPSHVFNKCIFENSCKIHHAHLNMLWQENKISPTSVWKMAS